jgi:hypothetical protein
MSQADGTGLASRYAFCPAGAGHAPVSHGSTNGPYHGGEIVPGRLIAACNFALAKDHLTAPPERFGMHAKHFNLELSSRGIGPPGGCFPFPARRRFLKETF